MRVFGEVVSRTLFLDLWITFSGFVGVDMDDGCVKGEFGGSSLTGESFALEAII